MFLAQTVFYFLRWLSKWIIIPAKTKCFCPRKQIRAYPYPHPVFLPPPSFPPSLPPSSSPPSLPPSLLPPPPSSCSCSCSSTTSFSYLPHLFPFLPPHVLFFFFGGGGVLFVSLCLALVLLLSPSTPSVVPIFVSLSLSVSSSSPLFIIFPSSCLSGATLTKGA